MRSAAIRELLQTTPFRPIRVGLSDGRYVLIRHPDQVVLTPNYLMAGVIKIGRSEPLVTPNTADEMPAEAIWVALRGVVSVELDDAAAA